MGQQDRDYWRERYNKLTGHRPKQVFTKDTHGPEFYLPQEGDSRLHKSNELSFLGKFVVTICVLLGAAFLYRYLR